MDIRDARGHVGDYHNLEVHVYPRKEFNQESLYDLVCSIKDKGVLQPLIVRKNGDKYEIIAGERRWRASKLAGLDKLPVIEKELNNYEFSEISKIASAYPGRTSVTCILLNLPKRSISLITVLNFSISIITSCCCKNNITFFHKILNIVD